MSFALYAPRSIYALIISILILCRILARVIPRLIAFSVVYAFNSVGIGGSYMTILLIVKALPYTSRPIIQNSRQAIAVLKDPLIDRYISRH